MWHLNVFVLEFLLKFLSKLTFKVISRSSYVGLYVSTASFGPHEKIYRNIWVIFVGMTISSSKKMLIVSTSQYGCEDYSIMYIKYLTNASFLAYLWQ